MRRGVIEVVGVVWRSGVNGDVGAVWRSGVKGDEGVGLVWRPNQKNIPRSAKPRIVSEGRTQQ